MGKMSDKLKAVAAAVAAIEKQFGRGAVMQQETDAGCAEREEGGALRQLCQETAAAGMALAIEDRAGNSAHAGAVDGDDFLR